MWFCAKIGPFMTNKLKNTYKNCSINCFEHLNFVHLLVNRFKQTEFCFDNPFLKKHQSKWFIKGSAYSANWMGKLIRILIIHNFIMQIFSNSFDHFERFYTYTLLSCTKLAFLWITNTNITTTRSNSNSTPGSTRFRTYRPRSVITPLSCVTLKQSELNILHWYTIHK